MEYLDRILLQNEIFADRVSFLLEWPANATGLGSSPAQPHIRGADATPSEIVRLMTEELVFRQLAAHFSVGYENSLAFVREDVAVFDLRPANVVRTHEGLIIPIDSIPCRLNESARKILSE